MATTTNFGWTTPDDTDLVKDGAAAIRTLGSAIDTSLVDLKGGTTGQILAKNSNTDLDFIWTSDATGIQATIFDAKGDLIAATAADTAARLASSGVNGEVLTVDTSTSTGLKWAAVPASADNWSLVNAGGTALTGAATITVSGITGANQLLVLISGGSSANASSNLQIRFNADSGSNYNIFGFYHIGASTYAAGNLDSLSLTAQTEFEIAKMSTNAGSTISGYLLLGGGNSAGTKVVNFGASGNASGGNGHQGRIGAGYWANSATITSVSIISSTGNWDAGTVYVYKA